MAFPMLLLQATAEADSLNKKILAGIANTGHGNYGALRNMQKYSILSSTPAFMTCLCDVSTFLFKEFAYEEVDLGTKRRLKFSPTTVVQEILLPIIFLH